MLLKISIAMLAFAANSVLCRLALAEQQIDPMSFSLLRVCSGAMVLFLLYMLSTHKAKIEWSVKNGFFLALYIVAFSLAYLHIDAGVGALLLFGTVQLSMVSYGLCDEQDNRRNRHPHTKSIKCILCLYCSRGIQMNPVNHQPSQKYCYTGCELYRKCLH